jgi:hypothetical protein
MTPGISEKEKKTQKKGIIIIRNIWKRERRDLTKADGRN